MKQVRALAEHQPLPPGYPVDVDFKPRYNPWDQRMCLVADGDVFEAISKGRLEVVTDHIDHFDARPVSVLEVRPATSTPTSSSPPPACNCWPSAGCG